MYDLCDSSKVTPYISPTFTILLADSTESHISSLNDPATADQSCIMKVFFVHLHLLKS